jgi:hypothetical protein
MKRLRFEHILIIVLVLISILFYALQEMIFHNPEESSYLFFQDLAFLPLDIVLVTFVLERVLRSREKRDRLEQLNIVISAFFTETGSAVLETLQPCMDGPEPAQLNMDAKWTDKMFTAAARDVRAGAYHAHPTAETVTRLKELLPQKKAGILAMFANPNLLEHDTFTDMLWALYHLIDELESRTDASALPASDISHLGGDMARAWGLLVGEWVGYMKHLKHRYPYLWSLAVRKNPFTQNSVVIRESASR